MHEYVTEALVLAKEPLRDFDARYGFFTKRFVKLKGKATSARKPTSKLAGHLEPGTLATVRFVERNGGSGNGAQIVDALKYGALGVPLADLGFLSQLLPDGEPEPDLWAELMRGPFSWEATLRILGWDPHDAVCENCNRGNKAAAFYVPRQEFFCASCASKLKPDTVLLLRNAQV